MPRDRRQKRAKKTLPQGERFIRYSQTFNLSPPSSPSMLLDLPILLGTREYIFMNYPENTHKKKSWTHKIPTRRNIGPKKYPRQKIVYPQNTNQHKFWAHEWAHEIPRRRSFKPTKHPQEKALDPRNAREKIFRTQVGTMTRWRET